MIIVLKGADFSANNIGKIDIPRELTAGQKAMLASYSKELTYEQKMAFGTFMDALDDGGITPKIKVLCMPILAGDKSEAFVNLASTTYGKEIDLGASEYYGMLDDGIASISEELGVVEQLNLPSAAGLDFSNIHLLCASNTEYKVFPNESAPCVGMLNPSATNFIQFDHKVTTDGVGCCYSSRAQVGSVSFTDLYNVNTFNVQARGKILYGITIEDGTFTLLGDVENSQSYVPVANQSVLAESKVSADFKYNGYRQARFKAPHWIISIGEGLTLDEAEVMKTAMLNFLRAFGKVE